MGLDLYITTSYAVFSLFVYCIVSWIILRKRKAFNGSYYKIFVANSAVNCFTYLNSLLALRLPRITCQTCFLSSFFKNFNSLLTSFVDCLYTHLAYVQYLMILTFIVNRLTALVFPLKYERIWEYCFWPTIGFVLFSPLVFTYEILTADSYYFYSEKNYLYFLTTITELPNRQPRLLWSLISITLASTFLMIITFFIFISLKQSQSIEWKLLAYSMTHFVVEAFATIDVLLIMISTSKNLPTLAGIATTLLPYTSDALTFTSPYILLICSPIMRKHVKLFCGLKKQTKITKVISVQ